MGKRVKVTITGYYEPVLDNSDDNGYTNVEWPVDSGEFKSLTTVEEAAAYDEQLCKDGSSDPLELIGEDWDIEFEVMEEDDGPAVVKHHNI